MILSLTKAQRYSVQDQLIADAQEALFEAERVLADELGDAVARRKAALHVGKALSLLSVDLSGDS